MRVVKYAVAFVLVFCMLALTIVCSALATENEETVSTGNIIEYNDTLPEIDVSDIIDAHTENEEYVPRLTAPEYSDLHYYSDDNPFYKFGYGMPNCTAYAWGRAYELLGEKPKLCIYDANEWYDYNIENKCYAYGQEPKLGAIACYRYKNYDSGHVAVVEKITEDKVYYSNSAWGGSTFYMTETSHDDYTGGNSNWEFQGFIYVGEPFTYEYENGDVYKITSANGVNMRRDAGTSFEIVSAIPFLGIVTVVEYKEAQGYIWGYTKYKGISGWFVTDFAECIYDKEDKPIYVVGDVDMDSEVTIFDATMIQRYLASIETFSQEQLSLADTDGDGSVSVLDATKISRKLAGLE